MRSRIRTIGFVLFALALSTAGCAAETGDDEELAESEGELVTGSFVAKGTGYYPDSSALEGGFLDRKGAKLRTLQQFLNGQATYVSVAMDSKAFPYGQHLRIKEFEQKYGRAIDFRVVDTGGAFKGKGRTRIDICTANRAASLDKTVNGTLHIEAVTTAPTGGPTSGGSTSGGSTSGGGSTPPPPPPPPPPSSGGAKCASDGACNPGNDGSGLICVGGQCVPGCRSNAQCPGVKTCVGGQCR